jgi:hypothetical protein
MKALVILLFGLLFAIPSAAASIEAFGYKWTIPMASEWIVEQEEGEPVLRLLAERPPEKARRPVQFALAETPPWQRLVLECEMRRIGGSMIVVYAWRDDTHFNYAHLSVDEGTKQPVHNGIFHVYGGDRVRISPEAGPAALPAENVWHKVQLKYDATTGMVAVKVNGQEMPSLKGVDLSLGAGRVGLGSFGNKGSFRRVKISGTPARH